MKSRPDCSTLPLQVYEAKGGGYEKQEGSKNEAKKGEPEPKDKAKKAASKKTGQVAPASFVLPLQHYTPEAVDCSHAFRTALHLLQPHLVECLRPELSCTAPCGKAMPDSFASACSIILLTSGLHLYSGSCAPRLLLDLHLQACLRIELGCAAPCGNLECSRTYAVLAVYPGRTAYSFAAQRPTQHVSASLITLYGCIC